MMKLFKHLLPLVLLLSLCAGLLTGCNFAAAEEPPAETQTQEPSATGAPEDDGIFTITDDERVGEVYQKILNGEIVLECFDESTVTGQRSSLYVAEYLTGILKQLNTVAVEPITHEDFQAANGYSGAAKYVFTAESLSAGLVVSVRLGGHYIALYLYANDGTARVGCFKTEREWNEVRNEIQSFWNAEERNSFHGIADSGKVGEAWRAYMAEGATALTGLETTHKLIIRDGKTSKILSVNDIENEEREAFWNVYRQLEDVVAAELDDVCEHCCDDTWSLENELNTLEVRGKGMYYGGMSITLYQNGVKISNYATRQVAYFSVAKGSTQSIHGQLLALLNAESGR